MIVSPRAALLIGAAFLGYVAGQEAPGADSARSAAAPSALSAAAAEEALASSLPVIAPPRLPGRLEAASHFYRDDHGLYVSTTGAEVEHPLGGRLALRLRALADWIGIFPPDDYADQHAGHLPGGGDHGHHDPGTDPGVGPDLAVDAISGASARAASEGSVQELRGEGGAGLVWRGRHRGRPAVLAAESRGSWEPDYQSGTVLLSGSLEAFQGNTTVSSHAGFTIDRIDPEIKVRTRGETWPALQAKAMAGGAVHQTLTPRLALGAGASGAWLQGRLSSPYRNALVVSTLFPERLPADRLRLTAFVQGAYYLGRGMALHSRQGLYLDSWGVEAWIPETALAVELGPRFLLTLRHRSYVQRPASFYATAYAPGDRLRTGDVRLGGLEEHGGGVELDWRLPDLGGAGPLVLTAGYARAWQVYWSLPGHDLESQVFRLAAALAY